MEQVKKIQVVSFSCCCCSEQGERDGRLGQEKAFINQIPPDLRRQQRWIEEQKFSSFVYVFKVISCKTKSIFILQETF